MVGFTAYYSDGSSGAYLATMTYNFSVPALNISTRFAIGSGADEVGIRGFIVLETPTMQNAPLATTKKVIVRAIGPSLGDLGVGNPLADPVLELPRSQTWSVLELYNSTGALLASNDDWKETQQSEIEDAGLAPTDDRESALQAALVPGAYTAIVRGKDNSTGVGLVEAYNLETNQGQAAR